MICFFICLLNGCTLLRLQKEVAFLESISTVEGHLENRFVNDGPIILSAVRINEWGNFTVVEVIPIYQEEFKLSLPPGKYLLFAFQDENNDEKFQHSENVGWYGKPWQTVVVDSENISGINIVMYPEQEARSIVPELFSTSNDNIKIDAVEFASEEVITLDDPRFSDDNAKIGLWNPIHFIQTVQTGLYFLEPYHADKIPVLFVHGVNGHPGVWSYLVEQLDHDLFQPWFFYYASGFRLGPLSEWLSNHLYQLQGRYNFKHVYIVAHSMGGLVSKAAINHYQSQERDNVIKLLVTLSTPWGGHEMAQTGLSLSPFVIPNWHDMDPDSQFLDKLFSSPQTEQVPFQLLFSYKGGSSVLSNKNSDGVIALKSQLRQEAQDSAEDVYGFDENHTSILQSHEVSDKLNHILLKQFKNK